MRTTESRQNSPKAFISFLIPAVLLALHSLWLQPLSKLINRRLFFEPDAIFILAATLVIASFVFLFPVLRMAADKIYGILQSEILSGKIALGFILTAAFGLLVYINGEVLHHFLNSADEHSCYFLAETLRLGKWWVKPHELSEFFNVIHVGNKAGKWFSVYPPGWPALWAIGLNLHIQDYLNPIMSVLTLLIFYQFSKKLYGQGVAIAAAFVTAFSAFFLFTGASYYSHTTCMLLMVLFAYAYLKWTEADNEKDRIKWTLVIGFAVGYGLLTRYLTMAAFAAPFLIYRVIPLITRKRKIRPSDIIFFAMIALAFSIIFWQNFDVTGKLHKAPNRFDKPYEKLGFRSNYMPWDGAITFIARFFYLTDWVSPFIVLAFILFTFKKKTAAVDETLFHYAFYFPAIAYVFYYSWGGNQYGPRYFYEGWPFMALAVINQVKQLDTSGQKMWRNFFVIGLTLSVFAGGYQIVKQSQSYEVISRERKALYVLAEEKLNQPSIVFIHGFLGDTLVMSQDDAVRNSPLLNAPILYAHDKGEENKRLMQYYPDHRYYRGTYDRKAKSAVLEEIFT